MAGIFHHFKHANSNYIIPELVEGLFVRPMTCIKELIRLE